MKKKPVPPTSVESELSEEILEQARLTLDTAPVARREKCSVCGGECAPNSTEGLCWVCRRLKISAWRDSDQQLPAQE